MAIRKLPTYGTRNKTNFLRSAEVDFLDFHTKKTTRTHQLSGKTISRILASFYNGNFAQNVVAIWTLCRGSAQSQGEDHRGGEDPRV